MAPWLQVLEAYAVQALLRTPAFHRGVEKVARTVHRVRHGTPPEEMGGTKIDLSGNRSFLRHFNEEIQTQLGKAENKLESAGPRSNGLAGEMNTSAQSQASKQAEEYGAEIAWRDAQNTASNTPNKGFLGEYAGALREQLRNRR